MKCEERPPFQWVVGVLTLFAVVLSFGLQFRKLSRLKTHHGLSLIHFCFETASNFFILLSYIGLSHETITDCCAGENYSATECFGNLLTIIDLVAIEVCAWLVVVLYMVYFDYGDASWELDERDEYEVNNTCNKLCNSDDVLMGTKMKICATILLEIATAVIFVGLSVVNRSIDSTRDFANVLDFAAAFLISVHWAPQIWLTYHLGSLRALSIEMVVIQFIGCATMVWTICNYDISDTCSFKFVPYVVSFIMIGVLVVMSAWFRWKAYRKLTHAEKIEERIDRERSISGSSGVFRERTISNGGLSRERTISSGLSRERTKSSGRMNRSGSDLNSPNKCSTTIIINNTSAYRALENVV